jgi:rhamnosyltransferase
VETSVGVAVITHCSRHHLPFCLPPIFASRVAERVLVVNSSSGDGTPELARAMGADTLVIPRSEFNHGLTRERARKELKTKIVVMMTPDAYLTGPESLKRLVAPVAEGRTAIAYARQIPHDQAGILEAFARTFNYPPESQHRSMTDLDRYGVYTYFCSSTCAAYSNQALDEIGGFRPVLTAEDTLAGALLLRRGYAIAYVADAVVKHSHRYTLKQEFRRYFDTGYMRHIYRELLSASESDETRGRRFVQALLTDLCRRAPYLIPYALVQSLVRAAGYKAGRFGSRLPVGLRRKLSAQDYYWSSDVFREARI